MGFQPMTLPKTVRAGCRIAHGLEARATWVAADGPIADDGGMEEASGGGDRGELAGGSPPEGPSQAPDRGRPLLAFIALALLVIVAIVQRPGAPDPRKVIEA